MARDCLAKGTLSNYFAAKDSQESARSSALASAITETERFEIIFMSRELSLPAWTTTPPLPKAAQILARSDSSVGIRFQRD
jgi:hypothetical protein